MLTATFANKKRKPVKIVGSSTVSQGHIVRHSAEVVLRGLGLERKRKGNLCLMH